MGNSFWLVFGNFWDVFFLVAFGSISLGLYTAFAEKDGGKSTPLGVFASFFGGYVILAFVFALVF